MYYFSTIYDDNYQDLQAWRREILDIVRKWDGWGDFQIAGRGVQAILCEIKFLFDNLEKGIPGQWRQNFKPEHLKLYDSISIIGEEGKKNPKAWFPGFKDTMERAARELSHVELRLFLLACCDAHNGPEKNISGMGPGEFFTGNKTFAKRSGADKASISEAWKVLDGRGYVKKVRGHRTRTLVRRVEMLTLQGREAESKDELESGGEVQE